MNAWDVILGLLIAAAVALAIRSMIRQRKSGGCGGCPYAGSCGHAGAPSNHCEDHHV